MLRQKDILYIKKFYEDKYPGITRLVESILNAEVAENNYSRVDDSLVSSAIAEAIGLLDRTTHFYKQVDDEWERG